MSEGLAQRSAWRRRSGLVRFHFLGQGHRLPLSTPSSPAYLPTVDMGEPEKLGTGKCGPRVSGPSSLNLYP